VARRLGISAESRATAHLLAKGYRILARRWRRAVGDIPRHIPAASDRQCL
jgi:putative endonuclease